MHDAAANANGRVIFFTLFDALVAAHISRQPWQVVAAMCALIFGAASMTALITADRAVAGNASMAVGRLTPDVNLQLTSAAPFSDRFVAIAQHVAGVSAARPVIERRISVETAAGRQAGVRFIGTDVLAPVFVDETARADLLPGPYSPAGARATPADLVARASVIVDERLRNRLAGGISATLRLRFGAARQNVRVLDVVRDDEIGTGGARVFADIDNAQAWLGLRDRVDRIDCIVDPARLAAVHARLAQLVPAAIAVSEPLARTQAILASTRGMTFALQTIGLFAALLAAFAAYNLFGAAVVQRRGDVATLRSLGAERGDLLRAFTIEALLYGVLGSIAGLALGMIFAGINVAAAMTLTAPLVTAPAIVVDARDAAFVVVLGIAATLAAAIVPAWRALARDALAGRRDPFAAQRANRASALVVPALIAFVLATAACVRAIHNEQVLAYGFAAVALAAALTTKPFMLQALTLVANDARRSDIRIAAALGRAHAGRTRFAAIPISAALSALCVASVLVASQGATLDAAMRAVFGTDAPAVAHSFDLTFAFLRGAIVLLIAVAAIAIGSIWFAALLERRTAYTTLRSLGMSDGEIARSMFIEVLLVAGLSCIAGLLAGLVDLGLIAAAGIGGYADPGTWRIPGPAIVAFAFAMVVIACVAAVPAAALLSRGSLRRMAD